MEKENDLKRFADEAKEANRLDFEYHIESDCIYIDKYIGNGSYIIIPNHIENMKVVSLGRNIFKDISEIIGVIIPDNVKFVDKYAFSYLRKIVTITVGSNVEDLEFIDHLYNIDLYSSEYSLNTRPLVEITPVEVINRSGCSYDTKNNYLLNVKKEGISDIVNLNGYLFYKLNNVNYLIKYIGSDTELLLPKNYHNEPYSIYNFAFSNCKNITKVILPNNIKSIGYRAFECCSNLISINIPDSVESFGPEIFDGCYKLQYNLYENGCYLGNEKNKYLFLYRIYNEYAESGSCIIKEECKNIAISKERSLYESGYVAYDDDISEYDFDINMECDYCSDNNEDETPLCAIINESSIDDTLVKNTIGKYALDVKPKGSKCEFININGYLFYKSNNGINYLVRYIGNEKNLVLPENFMGETYVIKTYALTNEGVESIVISSGVSSIQKFAIRGEDELREIIIDENVKEIDKHAFTLTPISCKIINNSAVKIDHQYESLEKQEADYDELMSYISKYKKV